MLSEALVRKVIGVEGAEVLIDAIEGAWTDHLAEGYLRTPPTRAAIVWDYMASRASAEFATMDGVREVVRLDRPMFVLQERFLLRLKKHSRELTPSNYPTASQQALARDGEFDDIPFPTVSCGYVLDKADAGVESLVVVSLIDGWSIDLRELAVGQLSPISPLLDIAEYREDIATISSIKRVRSDGGA